MPAGLIVPVSGPFVATWSAFPFGTMNDDGYELSCQIPGQEVNQSDAYGMTLTEAIYRGQNWKCRFRGLEWNKTGLLTLLQMFGYISGGVVNSTPPLAAATVLGPLLANIGDRWTKYCQSLVLTALLGNPPSTPQTLTALNAGFSPNSTTQFNLTSKVREMPIEMVLLPYSATPASGVTINTPFTTT